MLKIDGILVVNLDKRRDRWELFASGAESWSRAFGQTPQRISAVFGMELEGYNQAPWFRDRIKERRRKSWAGKAGAILSHRKAIQFAKDQGWGNVLILEDDSFLADEMADRWNTALSGMIDAVADDWAALYLYSAKPFAPCRVINRQDEMRLVEVMGAFGCVAYVVNGRVYDKLLQALPDENNIWQWVARYKAIDLWLSRNLRRYGRVLVFAPSPVGHQVGPSDITVTPESEWTFDGTMEGLVCENNPLLFVLKKGLRLTKCAWEEGVSFLRMLIKRRRGL